MGFADSKISGMGVYDNQGLYLPRAIEIPYGSLKTQYCYCYKTYLVQLTRSRYVVRCIDCKIESQYCKSSEAAIKAWNSAKIFHKGWKHPYPLVSHLGTNSVWILRIPRIVNKSPPEGIARGPP